jgi:magnesium transporter
MVKKYIDRAIDLMTTDYHAIHDGCTVAQAIATFRTQDNVKGSYVFVLNAQDSLIVFISLSSLLRFSPGEVITKLIVEKVVAVHETDSQEKITRLIYKYKLEAIPVVDEQRRILGIVTARDALDYLIPQSWKKELVNN